MIDFPASPTLGQQFTAAGVTWVWDGAKWTASGLSTSYVPTAGYVPAMGDNRLINGDMRIDQRNNGASFIGQNTFPVDRWNCAAPAASNKFTWGRNLNSANGPTGFPYYLGAQSNSAYTSLTTETFYAEQRIEADAVSDFVWGTPQAQPATLSFYVLSSLAGTFSGSILNYAGTRSYPFSYSVPVANTWTKIVTPIPGDTGGTWVMSGNSGGIRVAFDYGCGATYRGPAAAWTSTPYFGVTGAVSVVATNAATLYVTGVKLEIGSVATAYNRQSLAKSMADCQRYYTTGHMYMVLYNGNAAQPFGYETALKVTMRVAPTINIVSPTYANSSAATTGSITPDTVAIYATATAAGVANFNAYYNASAEL